MKKRVCLILIICLLAACLCACGSDAGFSKEDLSLTVAGTEITPDTPVSDILAALGEDYDYAEAIS